MTYRVIKGMTITKGGMAVSGSEEGNLILSIRASDADTLAVLDPEEADNLHELVTMVMEWESGTDRDE